jgi:hypothetical protein
VDLRRVESKADTCLFNEALIRYHYLGFKPLVGAQARFMVEARGQLLGVVGFAASAWRLAPRDRWIGWSDEQRRARLHLVVNQARFLILPWIRVKNLASFVLSRSVRIVADEFERRYAYRPLLLETFVDRERFSGVCYRAANWIEVGETQGRGKLDRHFLRAVPVKKIFLYPLAPKTQRSFGRLELSTGGRCPSRRSLGKPTSATNG